jgi:response regulator RpfG family c-di-GMP phosphodiesterase
LEVGDTKKTDRCVVDMRLPGMNGNEFILAAHGKLPEYQFIIHI